MLRLTVLRTVGEWSRVGYALLTLVQGVNVGRYTMRIYGYTLIKLFEQCSDGRERPIGLPSYGGKLSENFAKEPVWGKEKADTMESEL